MPKFVDWSHVFASSPRCGRHNKLESEATGKSFLTCFVFSSDALLIRQPRIVVLTYNWRCKYHAHEVSVMRALAVQRCQQYVSNKLDPVKHAEDHCGVLPAIRRRVACSFTCVSSDRWRLLGSAELAAISKFVESLFVCWMFDVSSFHGCTKPKLGQLIGVSESRRTRVPRNCKGKREVISTIK